MDIKRELDRLAEKYGEGELRKAVRKWIAQVKAEQVLLKKIDRKGC